MPRKTTHVGDLDESSELLPLVWLRPSHCGRLGSKSVDVSSLNLPISPFLSVTLSVKYSLFEKWKKSFILPSFRGVYSYLGSTFAHLTPVSVFFGAMHVFTLFLA